MIYVTATDKFMTKALGTTSKVIYLCETQEQRHKVIKMVSQLSDKINVSIATKDPTARYLRAGYDVVHYDYYGLLLKYAGYYLDKAKLPTDTTTHDDEGRKVKENQPILNKDLFKVTWFHALLMPDDVMYVFSDDSDGYKQAELFNKKFGEGSVSIERLTHRHQLQGEK